MKIAPTVGPTFVKTRRAPPTAMITTQVEPKFVQIAGQTGANLGDHTQPDAPSTVSVPGRRSLSGVDVLERSATLWEAFLMYTGISPRWADAFDLWLDWRNVPCRYADLGDLSELANIIAHRGLRLSALCGPCDPALDLAEDIPIEAALPSMRWAASQPTAVHPLRRLDVIPEPVAGVPSSVEVIKMLSTATINGEWGLFGNAKRAGYDALMADPRRNYLAFLVRRFTEEFSYRARLDQGQLTELERNSKHHLVTRFDDHCWVHPVHLAGLQVEKPQMGELLVTLMFEYVRQDVAEHTIFGTRIDVVELWARLRGIAFALLTDYPDVVPDGISTPDGLIAVALRRAGVTISKEEAEAMHARLHAASGHDYYMRSRMR